MRLLDSTGISHQVRNVHDWNYQACANDLLLYVSSTEDANTLLSIVSKFQEWIGLKICIQKSLAKGALYGKGEAQRKPDASTEARKRKALVKPHRTSKAVLHETRDLENVHFDSADDLYSEDKEVSMSCDELASQRLLQRCGTRGRNRSPHYFKKRPGRLAAASSFSTLYNI